MIKKILFLTLTLAFTASANLPLSYAQSQRSANYAQAALLLLPPPPPAGSPADTADLAIVRDWQIKRTETQCAKAKAEMYMEYDDFFGDLSPFSKPLNPSVVNFLKRVAADSDTAVSKNKHLYNRPRPFNRDRSLSPCIGKVPGLSYPSGHATVSRLYALILGELVPERKQQFMARADESALYRVISGVHHPSDIEAGKRLANMLYAQFLKNAPFRADMAAMRAYIIR